MAYQTRKYGRKRDFLYKKKLYVQIRYRYNIGRYLAQIYWTRQEGDRFIIRDIYSGKFYSENRRLLFRKLRQTTAEMLNPEIKKVRQRISPSVVSVNLHDLITFGDSIGNG